MRAQELEEPRSTGREGEDVDGYGTSAFEFAKNKPLELLDGSNLRYPSSAAAK